MFSKILPAGLSIMIALYAFHILKAETRPTNCGERTFLNSSACVAVEEKLLDATVRIAIESWVVLPDEKGYDTLISVGHGTVRDGRYLVTHNHFELPLNIRPASTESAPYVIVTLFDRHGEQLYKGPISDFEIVTEDEETLVFAHKDDGFFARLGFASADFQSWQTLGLGKGMTVAQIDWDGQQTRVDWVTVNEIILENGTPRLVLADEALPGASGGGVFWNGVHIANNWRVEQHLDGSGQFLGAVTTVALNSESIING